MVRICMTETRQFQLTAAQSEIFSSTKRFCVVNAGRRFGKTWLSGAKIMEKCINYTGKIVIYIAPTLVMARNLMWDTWIKEHIPDDYVQHKNEQFMVMTFKNGSKFYCLSAEHPDRLRGLTADLLIVDECAMIANGFYDVIRPLISDKHHDGEALYISTPKGYNWFYDMFCKGRENPKTWDCFEFTTLDGGNVDEEEIAEARRDMSPKMFAQEYLASFETVSNRVYYNYDRIRNACEKDPEWGKHGDIYVGMDFNVNPMTAAIAVWERGSLYFFDEFVEKGCNTQTMADMIKKKYPGTTVFVFPDPTGRRGQTNAPVGVTDMSILRKAGFIVCAPPHAYASKDKWNSVNTAFLNAEGKAHAFVAKDTCPQLKKAWEGYAFKDNEDPDKSSGLDHISDAAAYLITYKLPAFNRKVRRPTVLGV